MNYLEIQTEVLNLVDSGTPTLDAAVPALVNEVYRKVAMTPGLVLPSLKRIATFDTVVSTAYATLPATYDCVLKYAALSDGTLLDCNKTLEDIFVDYAPLTTIGDIEVIALEGNTIWYANIPEEATTVSVLLSAFPTELVQPTDIPTAIPPHLHRPLLIAGAASILFDKLEQEEETKKPNTLWQRGIYEEGIIELREYLASRRRGMCRSIWNY